MGRAVRPQIDAQTVEQSSLRAQYEDAALRGGVFADGSRLSTGEDFGRGAIEIAVT
jgi:hypothetical protein